MSFLVGASFYMYEKSSSIVGTDVEQREPSLQLIAGTANFCIKGTDDVVYKWQRIEDAVLNDLSDITAPSPSVNDVLKWNGAAWVNGTFTVAISGTPGYIPKFNGAGTDIIDSIASCDTTTFFIPSNKLIGFGGSISSPKGSIYYDGTDLYIENVDGSTKFILDTVDHTDALDIYQGADSYITIDTVNGVLELASGAGISKIDIGQTLQVNGNLINYDGSTSNGLYFDNLNAAWISAECIAWGDATIGLTLHNNTAFAQYLGAGLVLGGAYDGAQNLVGFGFIKGVKETAVDGNTDGQLHLGTKSHGSAPTTHMYIDSTGGLFLLNLKSGATQVAAGAAANEVWVTSGHATQEDNTLMIGV